MDREDGNWVWVCREKRGRVDPLSVPRDSICAPHWDFPGWCWLLHLTRMKLAIVSYQGDVGYCVLTKVTLAVASHQGNIGCCVSPGWCWLLHLTSCRLNKFCSWLQDLTLLCFFFPDSCLAIFQNLPPIPSVDSGRFYSPASASWLLFLYTLLRFSFSVFCLQMLLTCW